MNTIPQQHTLLPCPLCGTPARLEWSGVLEYSGRAWQYCSVGCSNIRCDHEVTLNTDSDRLHRTKAAPHVESAVVAAWNTLAVAWSKGE